MKIHIETYYQKTEEAKAHNNIKKLVEEMELKGKTIIDLGCGAGRDSVFLIQHGANVIGIDQEDVEERIKNKLNGEQRKNFIFKKQRFEEINLQKCDGIIANYSLFFCQKQSFSRLWSKIEESLGSGDYFVGNFIGTKDSWANIKKDVFVLTKEEVLNLFKKFTIIQFTEREEDKKTALGKKKHWHIYEIIARKK